MLVSSVAITLTFPLPIVLSNSIASIDAHKKARQWLMDKMRIVALFDLPANVFAETGVNTTIIVAYKPKAEELQRLKEQNYDIFVRDGRQGVLPQPEKDLERPSSTRLEARFPYYDLRVKTRSPSPFAWRPDFLAAPREAH